MATGFHQLRVDDVSIDKTAFRTPDDFFKCLVMPFGLTNAPAYFVDLMSRVFREFLTKFVLFCIDDILIFSKNEKEHAQYMKEIMETLSIHQLKAKFSKCHFWREDVRFLGHIVSKEGLAVDPAKVVAVQDW